MIEVGNVFEGKVLSVMPFGAFVDIGKNKSGLVHVSEISQNYVKDINEHLKKGDTVKVKVIKIDDNGKISLSIKQAETKKEKKEEKVKKPAGNIRPADIDWSTPASASMSFEDKLSRFKQDSDEKMQALKRSNDSKRSGGYSRRGGR